MWISLSFDRLAHRVFAEVGGDQTPVLEDVGKDSCAGACGTGTEEKTGSSWAAVWKNWEPSVR